MTLPEAISELDRQIAMSSPKNGPGRIVKLDRVTAKVIREALREKTDG